MLHRKRFIKLAVVSCLVAACRDAQHVDAVPAPAVEALPAPDPKLARVALSDRLVMEADARPARAVRGEQLFADVKSAGISFSRQRQVLASVLGASYCQVAITESGLAASICEFSDAASAERGARASRQAFDQLMPGRVLETRDNSLLTVTKPDGARAETDAATLLRTFRTLEPTPAPAATSAAR